MQGLTTALLGRACRIFLDHAYPAGPDGIPPAKAAYRDIPADAPLEPLLAPPVCQPVADPDGRQRGYAWRLGCATYPHLKMQAIDCDRSATWVFAVDTHDTIRLDPGHPDAAAWAQLQAANRRLKEQIERAWADAGLLTFHSLLRRGLDDCGGTP